MRAALAAVVLIGACGGAATRTEDSGLRAERAAERVEAAGQDEVRGLRTAAAAPGGAAPVVMEESVAEVIEDRPDARVGVVAEFMGRWSPVLMGEAGAMVAASDGAGIDWRLLPVIAVLESQAGAQACGFNPFGYASCRVMFGSWEEAIARSASTLAGYGGGVEWQLCMWNQGARGCEAGLAAGYVASGMWLMGELESARESVQAAAAGGGSPIE